MKETKIDLKIADMLEMSYKLWEKNKDSWSPMEPEYGRSFILYMIEEIGEAIAVIKKKGEEYFTKKFIPKFDNITTIGLLLTLIIIFSFQGDAILKNPLHVLLIAVPLILQNILTAAFAYWMCKLTKQPHNVAAPAALIGASDFFELSVAVAIALFGPTSPVVLVCTVGVLTEVPVMLLMVRFVNKTKHWFDLEAK